MAKSNFDIFVETVPIIPQMDFQNHVNNCMTQNVSHFFPLFPRYSENLCVNPGRSSEILIACVKFNIKQLMLKNSTWENAFVFLKLSHK